MKNVGKKIKDLLGRHKKLCIVLIVLVVLAGAGAVFVNNMRSKMQGILEAAAVQETAAVERRSLVESISATGKVTSGQSKSVSVPLSNIKVQELNIKVGDSVAAGDVLCVLDASDLKEDLADAQTTYNATVGRTEIDVSAAQRNLSDAETSREIEVARANKDEASAHDDYLKALNDEAKAKEDYLEAQQTTISKNGELEHAKEKLEDAKKKMEGLAAGAGQGNAYEAQFSSTVKALKEYLNTNNISSKQGSLDYLYITNAELSKMTADDIIDGSAGGGSSGGGSLDDAAAEVASYLASLSGLQASYQSAAQADAAYAKAQSEYQALQQEVASWETKYNSAKQSENSTESAYKQAQSTTDSKLNAYEQKQRSAEDTVRNNDSTVNSRTDSLATSRLSATTSGLNDKQQIAKLKEQIEDCTVTAPISGVVTEVNVEVGNIYNGNALAVIENIDSYEVEAEIEEYDISKITVGQSVVIKTNGTGELQLDGTVKEIAPRASSTAGSSGVTYKVTVSIDTPCDDLRMDMTAKLSIVIESKEDVLTVPYDALQQDADGSYYVEVVDETAADAESAAGQSDKSSGGFSSAAGRSGKPEGGFPPADGQTAGNLPGNMQPTRRITVEKGIESDYYVEIISNEIVEGIQVIVPASEGSTDFNSMIRGQGPMGGF